jgi:hypothetical protein
MHKITTPLKKTDLISGKKMNTKTSEMQPKPETLSRILQFAASYRVERTVENQFVEMILN